MPLHETITIINNSGKIISTGKQLVNIFKEAKASYKEHRACVKAERSIKRAQTFDVSRGRGYEAYEFEDRHRLEDNRSYASSRRTHRSRRSVSSHRTTSRDQPREHHSAKSRPALTESNLRTLSEISATAPSKAPLTYRSPYAESAPRDLMLSRPTLAVLQTPAETTPVSTPRQSVAVNRSRSDPALRKEVDMNLAYGNVPPDLASRTDLEPSNAENREQEATNLVHTVENLLDEAQCVHHTATSIISHLQRNPEAAAAVALTLAELSALLAKMSPGFLAVIKGGSPAVFALLASPQFLIGAGVAVGVTVVMFGGWKIIKHLRENRAAEAAAAAAAIPLQAMPPAGPASDGVDEALVFDEELSTIESWRRGIVPAAEDGSVDLELISPEAERAMRRHRRDKERRPPRDDGDDGASRAGRSERSHRSSKSDRTERSGKSSRSARSRREEVPERRSSRSAVDGGASAAGSHRSTRSKRTERTEVKTIEEAPGEDEADAVLQPRDRKGSMLKALFRKREKDYEKGSKVSVVA